MLRVGEGCRRHWLSLTQPEVATFAFADWTVQRSMAGYDKVRSFKAGKSFSLADGACEACKVCKMGEPPSYRAHVVKIALEGSAEQQQYREQMSVLMPTVVSFLECVCPSTYPVRGRHARDVDTSSYGMWVGDEFYDF